jgi:hypothetical protein
MAKRAPKTPTADELAAPTVWAHVSHLHAAARRDDEYAFMRSLGSLWNELSPGELDNPRTWAALMASPMRDVTPDELRTFTALLCAVWHNFAPLPARRANSKR